MAGTDENRAKRNARYSLADPGILESFVLRNSVSPPQTIDAELLDISREGVKLALQTPLAFEEVFQLQLVNQVIGLELLETARVRWIREASESESLIVGCSIEDEIPDEILEDLIECGLLDRRQSARNKVTKAAIADWEMGDEPVPVRLLNLSTDGFCLAADDPCIIGARLKLTLTDDSGQTPYEIRARSKWQQDFEKGYLIGCEMVGDEPFDLAGHCDPQTVTKENPPVPRNGNRLFFSVAVTLAVLVVLYISRMFS